MDIVDEADKSLVRKTNLEKILAGLSLIATYDRAASIVVGRNHLEQDRLYIGSQKIKQMKKEDREYMRKIGFIWDSYFECWQKAI